MIANSLKRHIVYDCDGTLVSTMEGIYQLMQDFFSKHLDREVGRREVIFNLNYDNQVMLTNFGLSPSLESEIEKTWMEFSTHKEEHFVIFEGIKDTLDYFHQAGFEQYVWTGRERASTEKILKIHNLEKYFKNIYCRDDGHPKPSVEGLKTLLPGVNPRDVVVIGDTYADVLGAKNFNAHAIGALWCENSHHEILQKYGADYMLKKPHEIKETILKIWSK